MFSCEFCEISKNTYFTEHPWKTYLLKIKNLWFSDLFRGYRRRTVVWNGCSLNLSLREGDFLKKIYLKIYGVTLIKVKILRSTYFLFTVKTFFNIFSFHRFLVTDTVVSSIRDLNFLKIMNCEISTKMFCF